MRGPVFGDLLATAGCLWEGDAAGTGCLHARILGGRNVPDPLEVPREMTLIGEPDLSSGLRGRNAGAQQDAGTLDAQLQLVGVWGNPCMECERAHQVKAAQPRQCNELVETDQFVEVVVQITPRALDRVRCLGVASCASLAGAPIILRIH